MNGSSGARTVLPLLNARGPHHLGTTSVPRPFIIRWVELHMPFLAGV